MLSNITIDTGAERSVTGHLVSGTVFSAIFAGSMNYNKYQKNEITKQELFNDTTKMALQGGIGTAAAVSTANYVGRGDWLGAMASIAVGATGIYATQKICEQVENRKSTKNIEGTTDV